MDKRDVARVLEEIGVLLELAGENPFKARSYYNVARQFQQTEDDLDTLVQEKRLREVKGVGDALEEKLTELVTTGRMAYHDELRGRFPRTLFELFAIPNLGAKRIKAVYEELGVRSLGELEYACNENRLTTLKGFGPKMQQKVLDGIAFAKKHRDRHLVSKAAAEARALAAVLEAAVPGARMAVAGSLRRRRETVKDIDVLVASDAPQPLMDAFVNADTVETVTGHGTTKSSVVLKSGIAADLRVVSEAQFPFALHYFTGSAEHNVAMRQRAKTRGLKLNEYGLFRGEDLVACETEAAIFAALDLPDIPPELREDMGEFDAKAMPALVTRGDLRGVLHCHSTYSDGANTVEQMALAARERGYTYFGIADHSQSASYAGGLTPEEVARQHAEIDTLNEKLDGIRILKGIESDIRADGALDYEDDVLKTFDFVVASVHSRLNMTREEATGRIVRAVENPHTSILGHPTGRLLLAREGYDLDWAKVFDACAATGTAIEINASPHRLDIDWRHIRRGRDAGVRFCIGPDAHNTGGLDDVAYGLGVARKGWLEAGHLLNCLTAEEFVAWARSS